MPLMKIDKGNSPLWVKILVWILAGGLMLASAFMAVVTIQQLIANDGQMAQQNQPITITPDQLSPEILEQLELEMQNQNQADPGFDITTEDGTIIGDGEDVPAGEEEGAQPE